MNMKTQADTGRIHKTFYDPMNVEAWEELRASIPGCGGSEIGAVLGLNPWESPYSVWARKALGIGKKTEGTNYFFRDGHMLEKCVAELFEERSGWKVRRCNAIIRNDAYPHLFANIDRMIDGQDAGLEVKTASAFAVDKFEGEDLPPSYYAQVVTYMALTEKSQWYLIVWSYGIREKIYFFTTNPSDEKPEWADVRIDIAPGEMEALAKKAAEFWTYVESKTPPPVDGKPATEDTIREQFVGTPGLEVSIDSVRDSLDAIAECDKQIADIEVRKEAARQNIMLALGDAEVGTVDGQKVVTFKTTVSKRLDSKAAKAALGSALDPYYTESSSRVLRFSRKKSA